jgi:Protein of unknown function (DUF3489)
MPKSKQSQKPKPADGAKGSPKTVAPPKAIAAKAADLKAGEPKSNKPKLGANSKQEQVLGMLRRPEGATIAAIMKATAWQQHSVRGFFAGVVRKRLGLTLESQKKDGVRTYRIIAAKPTKAKSTSASPKERAA